MSKKMERTELSEHCKDAIADLSSLLEHLIQSGIEKMTKRAMLIAYWLKTYVKYLRREDDFSSESVFRATPHRRNLSGIVENMIRFTYE